MKEEDTLTSKEINLLQEIYLKGRRRDWVATEHDMESKELRKVERLAIKKLVRQIGMNILS